jgi:AraC-like DNA-binding protein
MQYKEYLPAPLLRQYVECYWQFISSADAIGVQPVQRCLPLGTMEIIVQTDLRPCEIMGSDGNFEKSPDIYLTGLYTDTAFWRQGEKTSMFGIRLRPEGLIVLFARPVSLVVNVVVEAEHILGASAKGMCDEMAGVYDPSALIQIAEKYLLARLWKLNDRYNHAVNACRIIRGSAGDLTVEALAGKLCVSRRQLERSFREHIGLSPKTYQRIIRFRNAYSKIRSASGGQISWTQLSYSCGYSDQAHFVRDFRDFTGEVPTLVTSHREDYFQTLESVDQPI